MYVCTYLTMEPVSLTYATMAHVHTVFTLIYPSTGIQVHMQTGNSRAFSLFLYVCVCRSLRLPSITGVRPRSVWCWSYDKAA